MAEHADISDHPSPFTFWLGAHRPGWLGWIDVPLMVSHRTLGQVRIDKLPRATQAWVLDSGGFTEIGMFGGWAESPEHYAKAVRLYSEQVGMLAWAAPQDWMCEPDMLAGGGWKVGTHLSVAEHQRRTVANFVELRTIAPDLPIIPVLQGWQPWEYEICAEMFAAAGVDLAAEPVVGIGSVCRRTVADHRVAERSIRRIAPYVGPLHGFGVSLDGLDLYGDALGSSDSLAWSFWARHDAMHILDCDRPLSRHGKAYSYANCPGCALAYRREVVRRSAAGLFGHPDWEQLEMAFSAAATSTSPTEEVPHGDR